MNSTIPLIIEELRNQLGPIEEQEARLRTDLAELKEERQKLEAALLALGGGPAKAKPAKRGKPCITKQEVTALVTKLVRDKGPMTKQALETLAQERLAEDGQRSLSGFSLRLREALQGPEFQWTTDGLVMVRDSKIPEEVA